MKRIHRTVIAAIGLALFVQSGTGQTNCASSGPSSRACLIAVADQYFAALAAHDPSKAPMATNTRLMERPIAMPPVRGGNAGVTNSPAVQGIKIGEGLWKTITEGATGFKIYVPDPVLQEVGGIAMIKVENQPTALGFRLKLENGRITEAHHVLVKISDPSRAREPDNTPAGIPRRGSSRRATLARCSPVVSLFFLRREAAEREDPAAHMSIVYDGRMECLCHRAGRH